MVGADRVVNAVALNSVIIHTARILGPAAAGLRDRAARRRPLLPGQRALVRRRCWSRSGPWTPRACTRRRSRARAARPAALGAALRGPHAEPADPAGHDGRGRHASLQLPGPAPAAGQLHLARHRRALHRARGRHGHRLGGRRAGRRRARARRPAAAGRRRRGVRRRRAARRPRPHARAPAARADPARRRQRDLRGRDQLVAPARRRAVDARPRDGALLGRLPRLDADRRPARRLDRRGRRPARRPRGGRASPRWLAAAGGAASRSPASGPRGKTRPCESSSRTRRARPLPRLETRP